MTAAPAPADPAPAAPAQPVLDDACVPYLPRGVCLHDDKTRGIRVLLAPERAIQLDMIGDAILSELDRRRSLGDIIDHLARVYSAPRDQIAGDVREFLQGLVERKMVFIEAAS